MSTSIAAFFAALLFIALSTNQWRWSWRLLVWLVGVGLLGAAYFMVSRDAHYGLLSATADFFANLDAPQESFIGVTLQHQTLEEGRHFGAWLDVIIALTGALAVVALLAFTPGQKTERFVRMAGAGVAGAMLGALSMFALVALGLGGEVKPRVFAGYVEPDDVHDGDTFLIGEYPIRLFGVDAPELGQKCLDGTDCGARALKHLQCLVTEAGCEVEAGFVGPHDGRPALVSCFVEVNSKGRVRDSFGRPIAACRVFRANGKQVQINERMIEDGFAVVERDDGRYADAARDARLEPRGLMSRCWLRPEAYRELDGSVRAAFAKDMLDGFAPQDLVGVCRRGE